MKYTSIKPRALGLILGALLIAQSAIADTAIRVGYIPSTDGVALWVAKDQGFFTKRSINVTLMSFPTSPAATAAVTSGSIDVMLTGLISVFQAVDSELPFQIIAGAQILPTGSNLSIVVRTGSNIKSAADLNDKKVAVPGLGTALDVVGRRWITAHGGDVGRVKFVEASLSQVPDLLKSGQVDASVMADPFYPRLIQEKSAVKLGDLYDTAPPGVIIAGFSATRKWTEKNRAAIAEFRAALEEAAQFVKTHDPMARESMGKYMKLGPEVVAAVGMPSISTRVDASSLGWLLDVMYSQSLLQTKIDLSTLIAK